MSFALIRLFLGGALKRALGWLGRLDLVHALLLAVCIVLAVDHVALIMAHRHAHKLEMQLSKAIAGREADRRAYTKAQTDAAALNKAQVAHVKQQQQEITDATVSHLSARLQLIAGELRRQGSQSASGSAAASDPGAAPCRASNPAWLCLSPQDRLSAAENEERHDELIDWVIAQSKVDPNKP